jgi:protein TonB
MNKFALLSLLLTISFSYSQTQKKKNKSKKDVATIKVISLEERSNDIKADPDAVISPTGYEPKMLQEDENIIYNPAGIEIQPDFPGGNQKLFAFISKNFRYTDEMIENEIKGRVIASFIVEKDGSISTIKIIRGIGFGTEKEVERVLKLMPKWAPGEQNGKKVRCTYNVPIMIYATKQ